MDLPVSTRRIDQLLERNRLKSLREMTVEELGNMVDEMASEIDAICGHANQRQAKLRARLLAACSY